jgi:transposase InsO family protein
MCYSTNPSLEKARGKAMKLLFLENIPVQNIADRYGVNRSTIWRWKKKWLEVNPNIELRNYSKQRDNPTSLFRYSSCRWSIPTISSAPHNHPNQLPDYLVTIILDARERLQRCAEAVWFYLRENLGIEISLSSVRRILKRHGCLDSRKKKRNYQYKGLPRPRVLTPGDLVETDTIHLFNPISKKKCYLYTTIDLYTRMAYAKVYDELRPGLSVQTILEAQAKLGFKFKTVQADNGPEFGKHFAERLQAKGIVIRHTRLHRPNDNAHIERFNRTIQEECTGSYFLATETIEALNMRVFNYLDYYNNKRIHLGLKYMTPAQMLQRC